MRDAGYDALRRSALALVSQNIWYCRIMIRITTIDAPEPMPLMGGFPAAHAPTGPRTLASSILPAIEVRRGVRPL